MPDWFPFKQFDSLFIAFSGLRWGEILLSTVAATFVILKGFALAPVRPSGGGAYWMGDLD
jgi:hypothetical protein